MLPAIREISGEFFILQQDSAPAHRARETIAFLKTKVPQFISPSEWPPNNPDLNPVRLYRMGSTGAASVPS